jgi:hypothetical protein
VETWLPSHRARYCNRLPAVSGDSATVGLIMRETRRRAEETWLPSRQDRDEVLSSPAVNGGMVWAVSYNSARPKA